MRGGGGAHGVLGALDGVLGPDSIALRVGGKSVSGSEGEVRQAAGGAGGMRRGGGSNKVGQIQDIRATSP